MSGGVVDGQPVNQSITDAAFIYKNANDTMPFILALADVTSPSGTGVTNIQAEFNSLNSFLGKTINTAYNVLPSWTHNDLGSSTDSVFARVNTITNAFSLSGHAHSGVDGQGGNILAQYITDVPSLLVGATPSTGQTILGVVVNAPYNQVVLRNTSGAEFTDGSGNVVYG